MKGLAVALGFVALVACSREPRWILAVIVALFVAATALPWRRLMRRPPTYYALERRYILERRPPTYYALERWYILETIKRMHGNREEAARQLGITLENMEEKLESYVRRFGHEVD